MKKRDLKNLALLGLASGLLTSQQLAASVEKKDVPSHIGRASEKTKEKQSSSSPSTLEDPNAENEGYHLMSEEELFQHLNAKGRARYGKLDAEDKALVLKTASQRCQQTNECKGLNACKTAKNDCAGKGSCKGTGKCAFGDKNLVVKLVTKKMANKRAKSLETGSSK